MGNHQASVQSPSQPSSRGALFCVLHTLLGIEIMQLATFLGLLAASATAIVCPPQMTEAALALKLEGEACGGACQADGSCAEGLECQKPKTSPFSFAILAPSPAGVCQKPKTVTHMMGGVSDIGLDDEGVQ